MNYITVSICHKLILIFSILNGIHGYSTNVMYLVKQNNVTEQPVNISLLPEEQGNITEVNKNIDFIIKLQYILNEQKIIPFLREEIYNDHEMHNITTKDLLDLWGLSGYSLKDLSSILGIPSALFNSNDLKIVLDIANLTFSQYYTDIKGNISRQELQETLKTLGIDPAIFSGAITFGTEDEIFEILSKATYTWDKFKEVKNKTGLDIPELTKKIVLAQMVSKSMKEFIADIRTVPMATKEIYETIWNKLNISIMDVYRVENIRRIVDNLYGQLTENITFGIAISENDIILHKNILHNIGRMIDIVTIYGVTSSSHLIYDNLTLMNGMIESTSRLWSTKELSSKIDMMTRIVHESSLNCSYMSNDLTEHNVTLINITQKNIIVNVDEDVTFNMGNPLICNGDLSGLAVTNNEDENIFVFDAFFQKYEDVSASSISLAPHSYVILISILVYYALLFDDQDLVIQ